MTIVDLFLILAVIAALVAGYKQGFIVGLLGFIGFIGGAALGMALLPALVEGWQSPVWQAVCVIVGVLLLAGIGQLTFGLVGSRLRSRLTWEPAHAVDSAGGSVLSAVSVLVVAWFLALAVVAGPTTQLTREVRGSAILGGVDQAMPDAARGLFSSLREALSRSVFPDVFAGIVTPELVQVPPPDSGLTASPVGRQAKASIVEISGEARTCSRLLTGSGFVYAPERILTNAHVVAGTDSIEVQIGGVGDRYRAFVVLFDPGVDVAVLYVPGLPAPSLPFANRPAKRGDDALVAGFPGGGDYTVVPARVRDSQRASGLDIYGGDEVVREIYSLRTEVRPGNSGGPLLDVDGQVLGMIFAASAEDPETGYALTQESIAGDAQAASGATAPVSTGECD